jgi:hypothetical protein
MYAVTTSTTTTVGLRGTGRPICAKSYTLMTSRNFKGGVKHRLDVPTCMYSEAPEELWRKANSQNPSFTADCLPSNLSTRGGPDVNHHLELRILYTKRFLSDSSLELPTVWKFSDSAESQKKKGPAPGNKPSRSKSQSGFGGAMVEPFQELSLAACVCE